MNGMTNLNTGGPKMRPSETGSANALPARRTGAAEGGNATRRDEWTEILNEAAQSANSSELASGAQMRAAAGLLRHLKARQ